MRPGDQDLVNTIAGVLKALTACWVRESGLAGVPAVAKGRLFDHSRRSAPSMVNTAPRRLEQPFRSIKGYS